MERDCGFLIQETKEIYKLLSTVSPAERRNLEARLREIEKELEKANKPRRKEKKRNNNRNRSRWDDGT